MMETILIISIIIKVIVGVDIVHITRRIHTEYWG